MIKNNKNVATILSSIVFPMIWLFLIIIGSTITLFSASNKNTVLGVYRQNFQMIFMVYIITSFILILFGAWFARKFYTSK